MPNPSDLRIADARRRTARRKPANGYRDGKRDERKIAISFPEEIYVHLHGRALKEGTSFKDQVLTYLEWGMESEENALRAP